jgi:pimeloyl-ACP methyl ester carboxylesterase
MIEKYRKETKIGRYKISYFQKGQGRALVFLHSILNSARSFRHVFDTLALTNRVIVPDLIGYGASSKPMKFDYSLDSLADFVGNFFVTLKIKTCVLGGVSSGGALAMKIALKYPEKIEKLILVDSAGLPSRAKKKNLLGIKTDTDIISLFESPADLINIYLNQFNLDEAVSIEDRMNYLSTVMKKSVPECTDNILKANGMFQVDGIDQITAPTLIVWGERDKLLPKSQAERFTRMIKDSRYVMIPEAGHLPHEESPEDFNTVILDFLRGGIPGHK